MAPALPPDTPQEPAMSISTAVKLVAADLLRRGFAVFRQLGRASPCEFVIVKGRRCWRVAVRTARDADRPYSRGRLPPWVPPGAERFDVLADVLPDGVIRYEPPLERLHAPDTGTMGT
jgi:hypothetical protein